MAQKFRMEVLKTIEEEGIVEVYNADQTAMNYEYLRRVLMMPKGLVRFGFTMLVLKRSA